LIIYELRPTHPTLTIRWRRRPMKLWSSTTSRSNLTRAATKQLRWYRRVGWVGAQRVKKCRLLVERSSENLKIY